MKDGAARLQNGVLAGSTLLLHQAIRNMITLARIAPETVIPCIRTGEDVCRVSCECPGIYEPQDRAGEWVAAGETLGRVFDALTGEVRETITAPADGLVFSQRSYSPVYPGTLIARMFTGKCAQGGQNA